MRERSFRGGALLAAGGTASGCCDRGRATRLAIWFLLPLLSGCDGCSPEPEADVVEEIVPDVPLIQAECREDGLYIDGQLLVPSNPMVDPSPECADSSFRFTEGNHFHACCNGHCCDFEGEGSSSKEEGEVCASSLQCKSGLSCLPKGHEWRCSYLDVGADCDTFHWCVEGLYCDLWGKCRAVTEEEGGACQGSDQECAWPLACVCVDGDCACYDGSAGDPCESDSCGDGLYCFQYGGAETGTCRDGVAGDPCHADWQCNDGHGCTGQAEGAPVCARWFDEEEDCTQVVEGDFATCPRGMVCLTALGQPVCGWPGKQEAPCSQDSECEPGYRCIESAGKCYDGVGGDLCETGDDCDDPWTCAQVGEGPLRCYQFLAEGVPCDSSDPWLPCEEGLACLHSTNPSTCGLAAAKWNPCLDDAECGEGLFCLGLAALCVSGTEGEPCDTDEWCLEGLYCAGVPGTCLAGDFGDPCDEGVCQEGFECHPVLQQCFDGGPGTPCEQEADCSASTHCIGVWQGSFCTELLGMGGPCGSLGKPYSMCGYGLVCADPPGSCSDGSEGKPCANSFQCDSALGCHPTLLQCYAGDLGDPCLVEAFPCADGFVCRTDTQTCGHAVEGAPCVESVQCAQDMLCVAGVQACFHGDNGDPCGAPGECGIGFDCLMALGKCYDAKLGSPCIGDAWCTAGLSCVDIGEPRCVQKAAPGDACGDPMVTFIVCPEGTTCNSGYVPAQCAPPGDVGAACGADVDCQTDLVCSPQDQLCVPKEEGGQP